MTNLPDTTFDNNSPFVERDDKCAIIIAARSAEHMLAATQQIFCTVTAAFGMGIVIVNDSLHRGSGRKADNAKIAKASFNARRFLQIRFGIEWEFRWHAIGPTHVIAELRIASAFAALCILAFRLRTQRHALAAIARRTFIIGRHNPGFWCAQHLAFKLRIDRSLAAYGCTGIAGAGRYGAINSTIGAANGVIVRLTGQIGIHQDCIFQSIIHRRIRRWICQIFIQLSQLLFIIFIGSDSGSAKAAMGSKSERVICDMQNAPEFGHSLHSKGLTIR